MRGPEEGERTGSVASHIRKEKQVESRNIVPAKRLSNIF